MLSRPYLNRIPCQELIISDPGEGKDHIQATRDFEGRYAFVYIPRAGQTVELDMNLLQSPLQACWYDPRDGHVKSVGEFSTKGPIAFTSPTTNSDWVLVLDAVRENFPSPGKCYDE